MEGEDGARRRAIREASDQWASPSGASLVELAERQGWTKRNGGLRAAPAPQDARSRARTGVSKDEQARQSRASRLGEGRREALDQIGSAVIAEIADEQELRYLVDQLRSELSRRRKESPIDGTPSQN